MNEMIERAAIALYQADSMMLAIYKTGAESWPHEHEKVRERYRQNVRVVVEAMREPTDAMIAEAEACMFEHMPDARDWTVTMAKQAYQAAIDEALKE